jgi:CHAT domain-containing protein
VIELGEKLDARGLPLSASVPMSFVPSARFLAAVRPRPFAGPSVIAADPNNDLAEARREGSRVRRLFLPDAHHLTGAEVTRENVRAAWLSAPVFHFAGHGHWYEKNPWDSRLDLAGGQVILIEDILLDRPDIGLAVLNGCSTGSLGELDLLGLPATFLATGTRTVLATTSDIGDGEGRRFIESFYTAGGVERPGIAFRDAVAAAVRDGDESWRKFRLWGSQ